MIPRPPLARALLAVLAATALCVTAASQVSAPVTVEMGSAFLSGRFTRDLHAPEPGFRWTGETGRVRLPAPGPGRDVRVDATISAWRPRGQPLPLAVLDAGGGRAIVQTTPRPQTVRLPGRSHGAWAGEVELALGAPALGPTRTDARRLGLRLHRVRISTQSLFSPGPPPLRALVLALLLAGAVAATAARMGATARSVRRAGLAAGAVVALGHAAARAYTATALAPAAGLAVLAALLAPVLPAALRAAAVVARGAALRMLQGARGLMPARALALAAAAMIATAAAHAARPVLDLDVASGREEPFARGLLAYDAEGPVTFRHAGAGATLDLRALGGGGTWRMGVRASGTGAASVAAGSASAPLGPAWSDAALTDSPGWGWSVGPRLDLAGTELRLDRVRIERRGSLPSPRVVLAACALALLMAIAGGAAGATSGQALAAGLATAAAAGAALLADPILAAPLAPRWAALAALGALLAALLAAVNDRRGAPLPAGAIFACAAAFVAWAAAPLTPLYRGGHFVFHSSIAEEIWQGRLLHYALPYPGSMLSQQAQWGNVVVPHPCLFHVVAAPLAALPRPWFYTGVKLLLAGWLAATAAAAALVAGRLGGPRAAVAAAAALALTPATFQLIGLGHLMTVFGCWAMAMAVAFVGLRFERMSERRTFWCAAALLAVCFLSYTAALLFTFVLLALALPFLHRRHPAATRAVAGAALAGAAAAFFIYYVWWAWPFLTESVPRLAQGAGAAPAAEERTLWPRLLAQPHKLAYTFGTPLVPVAGLAGLVAALRVRRTLGALLLAWALLLPLFSAADLLFNFLLKHHYFTAPPVAVGIGVLLARLPPGRAGRWVCAAALAGMAVLAARVALDVATGRVP